MKTIILTTAMVILLAPLARSQSYEMTPTGNTSDLTVVIENLFGDISIEGTNTGAIKIDASDYEGIPEKAQGLKPLSATGPDNTEIGLFVNQEGNVVTISGAHRRADDADYTISIPRNAKLRVDYNSFQADDVRISNMANEVEVESKVGDIDIMDVTGPIVANSLSSDIKVVFTTVSQTLPTSISSTSGDIDITLPASTKANFEMKSISGEVYTDLDFDIPEEDGLRRFGGGMSASAKLNGGGVEVSLRCISGDVYIRKK